MFCKFFKNLFTKALTIDKNVLVCVIEIHRNPSNTENKIHYDL